MSLKTRITSAALSIGIIGSLCGILNPYASAAEVPPAQVTLPDGTTINLPVDQLGRPSPAILEQIKSAANTPGLPDQLRSALLAAVAFFQGDMGGGPELPENAPRIHQFGWPSVAGHCIDGKLDSVGSALAVVGPNEIPAPGAKDGETAFLFTALGTSAAAENQNNSMRVHWINVNNLKFGTTNLTNNGINPEGPATVSGVAETGKGYVVALLEGGVLTQDAHCSYSPTVAIIDAH